MKRKIPLPEPFKSMPKVVIVKSAPSPIAWFFDLIGLQCTVIGSDCRNGSWFVRIEGENREGFPRYGWIGLDHCERHLHLVVSRKTAVQYM